MFIFPYIYRPIDRNSEACAHTKHNKSLSNVKKRLFSLCPTVNNVALVRLCGTPTNVHPYGMPYPPSVEDIYVMVGTPSFYDDTRGVQ